MTGRRILMMAGGVSLAASMLTTVSSFTSAGRPLEVGYAVIEADPGRRVPVASALFSLRSSDILISEAGVEATAPIRRGQIFVDQRGAQTGLALANPDPRRSAATLTLRDAAGGVICRKTVTVEARGHLAKNVSDLLPNCALPEVGSLTFEVQESSPELAAITIRQSRNAAEETIFATLPVVNLDDDSSASPAVFPHIGAGPIAGAPLALTTQVILLNPGDRLLTGQIRLWGDDGLPLELDWEVDEGIASATLGVGRRSVFDYRLPSRAVFRATLSRPEGALSGYAAVTPDPGTARPAGTAIFQYRDTNGRLISEAGVGTAGASRRVRLHVDTEDTRTGLAIAVYGSQAPVRLRLTLLDRYGETMASLETGGGDVSDVDQNGHLAYFVDQPELFGPALPPNFRGALEIESDTNFFAVTLKLTFNADSAGQPILTTLPLANLSHPLEAPRVVLPQVGLGSIGELEFATRLILINQEDTAGSSGQLRFSRSRRQTEGDGGVDWQVPLFGQSASQHEYRVQPGAAGRLVLGDGAQVAGIVVPAAVGNEIPVAVGRSVSVRPRAFDESNRELEDFPFEFNSLDTDVARVDAFGRIEGREAGYSTLTLRAGGQVATAVIAVSAVEQGGTALRVFGITGDFAGRIYLSETSRHRLLRAESLSAAPSSYAGVSGNPGLRDGRRTQALFNQPALLALNQADGSLFVADGSNHVIRRVFPGASGVVETFAGTGQRGNRDGDRSQATFNNPRGVLLDDRGFLWVADTGNHTIRRVNLATGAVTTAAGRAGSSGHRDGSGSDARFSSPTGLALQGEPLALRLEREQRGDPPPPVTVVVADTGNGRLRRVREDGLVETLAAGPTTPAASRTSLSASPASFTAPASVAADSIGNIYVSEPDTGQVLSLLTTGELVAATQEGLLTAPRGLSITRAGRLLVADGETATQIAYAPPEITEIRVADAGGNPVNPPQISVEGGQRVTIIGRNFARDSLVIVIDRVIPASVQDTSRISFEVPPALPTGLGTLTVQHRGGLDQHELFVRPTPLANLSPAFITTVGGGTSYLGDGGPAASAILRWPQGLDVDSRGNIFIADTLNNRIRRLDALSGQISTIAGTNLPGRGGDGGPASAASLNGPRGIAVDLAGNVFIADTRNNRIRRVDAGGEITTIAGQSIPRLSCPSAVALDPSSQFLFISDSSNGRIVGMNLQTSRAFVVGIQSGGPLRRPRGIRVDSEGDLLIADSGGCDLECDPNCDPASMPPQGRILKMEFLRFSSGQLDRNAARLTSLLEGLSYPTGVAIGPDGANLFIASGGDLFDFNRDGDNRILRFNLSSGEVDLFAGDGGQDCAGNGAPATGASFTKPQNLAMDGSGNLWIADTICNELRKVDARTGQITNAAGGLTPLNTLSWPRGAAVDQAGRVFVADHANNRVLLLESLTSARTVAGNGTKGCSGDGGPAVEAAINWPKDLAVDDDGNLLIADLDCHQVRKVDMSTGLISTVAGTGRRASCEADFAQNALDADLFWPFDVAFDTDGSLLIAEFGCDRIRRVDSRGRISTVTGEISGPEELLVSSAGEIFASEFAKRRIVKVDESTGRLTEVLGGGFFTGLVFDSDGRLLVSDWLNNNRILRLDLGTGCLERIAGGDSAECPQRIGDSRPAPEACLLGPDGLSFDSMGNLLITDTFHDRVRAVRGPDIPGIPLRGCQN